VRSGIRIFTPDKAQLRENVARSGHRPLAMESASGFPPRRVVRLWDRLHGSTSFRVSSRRQLCSAQVGSPPSPSMRGLARMGSEDAVEDVRLETAPLQLSDLTLNSAPCASTSAQAGMPVNRGVPLVSGSYLPAWGNGPGSRVRDVTLSHCSVNSSGEQQIDFIAGFSSHETSNFLAILKTYECPTKHWGDRFVWRYHRFDEVGHVESAASAREARPASDFIT